jgi:hypothetical protein
MSLPSAKFVMFYIIKDPSREFFRRCLRCNAAMPEHIENGNFLSSRNSLRTSRAIIVSRCMLSLMKYGKSHETSVSCGSRESRSKTPRRLGTFNLQLVAGLGLLAGGVSILGRCYTLLSAYGSF